MCTVTIVPVKAGIYITSNRDEKRIRKAALPPRTYKHKHSAITYPKDADAGGTWIAMKDNGDAAVLLNGGLKKHIAALPYRKSRGLIFLDVFEEAPVAAFKNILLDNIEPFTLVLFINGSLLECRWDGTKKYIKPLQAIVPHIWSSVTLYDDEVIRKREEWFAKWLTQNPAPAIEDVLSFHRFGGDGDERNDLRMNRDGIYNTVSITAIELTEDNNTMHYLDLKSNQSFTKQIGTGSYITA